MPGSMLLPKDVALAANSANALVRYIVKRAIGGKGRWIKCNLRIPFFIFQVQQV